MSSEDDKLNRVTDFYGRLVPFYHLIFPDWNASIDSQASNLDSIIRDTWGQEVISVLDVSCGIGTQCLGLTMRGYRVSASDLSAEAVERAKCEAKQRGLMIEFCVGDMREAFRHHARTFDMVISCDNSVPHLLTDADILSAFRSFHQCLRPGGGCLVSVRDYEEEDRTGQTIKLYGTRREKGVTYLILQTWDWHGQTYDLNMYFIEDRGSLKCRIHVMRSRYYAVGIRKLMALLDDAGFENVARLDGRFFQPVIVGTRRT